jgi:tripartite-type tricarboxylate transporter receptor subunit TctC
MKKNMVMTCIVNIFVLGAFLSFAIGGAWAAEEKYPTRPIEIITPSPPGSYSDFILRSLTKAVEKILKVTTITVNKPGGGDMVAASAVANATPDGYTLGLLADGPLVYAHMLGRAPYTKEDIRVVGQLICTTIIMQVSATSQWKTFKEFSDYAHKNPGLTYGHVGVGSATWVRAEYLNRVGNLKMRGVPFTGDNEVVPALLGGHINAGFGSYIGAKQQADAGKSRVLFSFTPPGAGPDPTLPTIPSFFGKDVPDLPPPSNHLAAPGKTPEYIIKILEATLEKASKDPDFLSELDKLYANVCYLDSKATKAKHEEKTLQLTPIFQRAGLMK